MLAQTVDRRDAASRAAATSLPGPIETATDMPSTTASVPTATTEPVTTATEPAMPADAPRRLEVVRAVPVDPGGDGTEFNALARLVLDGSPRTAWHTEVYVAGAMSKKGGIGLRLQLAAPARLRRVVVAAEPAGATVAVYGVRGEAPPASATPGGWRPLAGATVLTRPRTAIPIAGRRAVSDVLVWITGLPKAAGGETIAIGGIALIGVPTGA